jgi:hypothetical protein
MQAIPNYTPQLREIVQLLSKHDPLPGWAASLIGVVVGFTLGMYGERLKHKERRKRLERAVYRELARNYDTLNLHWNRATTNVDTSAENRLAKELMFMAYDVLQANPEVKIDIGNIDGIEDLYARLKKTAESDSGKRVMLAQYTNACIGAYHDKIRRKLIDVAALRKYATDELKEAIGKILRGEKDDFTPWAGED